MTVHVAIICGLLGDSLGGAERQVIRLANALVESGMRVTLISKEGPRESLNLHPAIAHRSWYANDPAESLAPRLLRRAPVARGLVLQVIIASVRRARRLKARGRSTVLVDAAIVRLGRWVRGPKGDKVAAALYGLDASAVISFLTDSSRNVALAIWDDPMPLIVAVRSDPARDIRAQPWEALKYVAYSRASVVTVNARSLVSELARMPEIGASRARFVPNILIPNERPSGAAEQFLCVARLVRHKRLDLAIRAFAEVSPDLPDWRLVIAGDGPEREKLAQLARSVGVSERIEMLGVVDDIPRLMAAGGVMVHPSAREGVPNAVMEALQCGVPAIVMRECPGAVELIESATGPAGVVIDEAEPGALAASMRLLASDLAHRVRLGEAGRQAMQAYSSAAAAEVWASLLAEVRR